MLTGPLLSRPVSRGRQRAGKPEAVKVDAPARRASRYVQDGKPQTAQNNRSGAVTAALSATQVADHIGGYLRDGRDQGSSRSATGIPESPNRFSCGVGVAASLAEGTAGCAASLLVTSPALAISLAGMASQERPVTKLASPGRWAVRADLDDALLGASLVFAGAVVWGSAVAIRGQLPGRPASPSRCRYRPAWWPAGGRAWPLRGPCRSRP